MIPTCPPSARLPKHWATCANKWCSWGGAVAGLLVTDPAADGVRATLDLDAVVNGNFARFHRIEVALAQRGFVRDEHSGVICRWVHQDSGVLFDLMSVQPEVLGFSNRWYRYAFETAESLN